MTDKNKIKKFLGALANDDFVEANKIFPEVVQSTIKTLINKRKPDIINDINKKASELIAATVLTEPSEGQTKQEGE